MKYLEALTLAMTELSENQNALFLGQAVLFDGTGMFKTLVGVPDSQKIEFPVAEEMQLSVSTGLALAGYLPLCLFPRINFMMRCTDALVNHLDKLPLASHGGYKPKVLIRTAVADPDGKLNPGPQHVGDYSHALEQMLTTVRVVRLDSTAKVLPAYREAAQRDGSTLLIEYHALYGT